MPLSSILSLLEPLFSHYFVTLKFFATLLSWNKNIIIPRCEKVIKKASGPRGRRGHHHKLKSAEFY